ncbi:MAG: flagellar hook-basal body complex protein FliE [Spirochaetota bacterium]
MAIGAVGNGGLDLSAFTTALAKANGVQYTGIGSAGLATTGLGLGQPADDSMGIDGIGMDGIGLSAADIGLARGGGPASGKAPAKGPGSFEDALLKAMDGVNADQKKTSNLIEQMVVAPDSVNAHDVTIAMAEANLSLNLARTILDRITRGWKEVINTR